MYTKREQFKNIIIENTDETKALTVNEIYSKLNTININIAKATIYNYLNYYICKGTIEKRGSAYAYTGEKMLDNHEARFIADAIISSRILTKNKTHELLKKVALILGKTSFKNILDNYDEFCNFQPCAKADNEEIFYTLSNILSAKYNSNKISFKYMYYNINKKLEYKIDNKTNQEKIYIVSPYCLLWKNDLYYLLAYDEQAKIIKHYRIDRIVSCKEINETATCIKNIGGYEDGMDIHKYLMKCFNMFGNQDDQEEITVRLLCDKKQGIINKLIDKFGHDLKIYPDDKDKMIVLFDAFYSEGLLIWLMSFGDTIEVISPEGLRKDIKERAVKMVEMYGK